ncbi:hypothetical protein DF223_05225 [Mycetocola zhujimingii]|uniref:Uncharacterized protein n=2 Tax=Mycetocola zhujimingii TaxID=2079792 RepID=A0A2U1TFL1_9MICO|nr:hypothetical protein DF223_05225 [Mycetocola zhujimingii]
MTGKKPKTARPEKTPKQAGAGSAAGSATAGATEKPSRTSVDKRPTVRKSRSRGPGRFDGNRVLTVSVASLAVLSLIVVGVLLWTKNQNPAIERSMFEAYQSQQRELESLAAAAASDIDSFATLHGEASALNGAAVTALAAVAGFSDEPSRLVAETARAAFESSIVAQSPTRQGGDIALDADSDETLDADSSVEDLARGINTLNAEALLLDTETEAAEAAVTTLTADRDLFVAALAAFGSTIPATAEDLIDAAPDVDSALADAVTAAVAALTTAQEAGQAGVGELQVYADAAAALQAEQARLDSNVVIDEVEPEADTDAQPTPRTAPRTPSRPRATTPPTTPPATTPPPPVAETTPGSGESGGSGGSGDESNPAEP